VVNLDGKKYIHVEDLAMPNSSFKSVVPDVDGFGFLKQFWGGLPCSNAMTPTTDLQELDKRIADLKTIEQWLNLNLNMLRTTIQGIEVQRATLATLQSFGANMGLFNSPASVSAQASSVLASDSATQVAAAEQMASAMMNNATQWWTMMQEQFNRVAVSAKQGSMIDELPAASSGSRDLKGTQEPKSEDAAASVSHVSRGSTRSAVASQDSLGSLGVEDSLNSGKLKKVGQTGLKAAKAAKTTKAAKG
jgi:hypothetical protein